MVVREEVPRTGTDAGPAAFRAAVASMHDAVLRPEVFCEEMPAPQRIAPYASALGGDVTVEGEDVGTGRLILLHDPDGHDAWDGTFRCVAYVRADIEPDLGVDPLLASVGWSWLTDALAAHGAAYRLASGTVTRVSTESFGSMAEDGGSAQIEVRASWTPDLDDTGEPADVAAHVRAWGELLCQCAGLEPVPDGVATMPSRRGQRGPG